jgi:hypothetical protein
MSLWGIRHGGEPLRSADQEGQPGPVLAE